MGENIKVPYPFKARNGFSLLIILLVLPDLALPAGLGQSAGPVLLNTPLVHVLQTLVIQIDDDGLSFT